MSHVTTVDVEIKDLDALAEAAQQCGCELVRGKQTYKWFGKHVGDYPLPAGFRKQDLGKCDHVVRVKDANATTYEIGVVEKDGQYTLLYDFYAGGFGLMQAVGFERLSQKPDRLVQEYAVAVASKQLRKQGYRVRRTVEADGRVRLIGA